MNHHNGNGFKFGAKSENPTQNAFEYEICRSSPYSPVSIPNFEDNKSTAKPKICNCENCWSISQIPRITQVPRMCRNVHIGVLITLSRLSLISLLRILN
ncbi:hypothetical protein ACOSQ3_032599 [Xanthoceras sorbifolium]